VSESSVRTTERLQRMIDAGGHVVVPPGAHVVRTLHLRSGVTFEIPHDATLLAHRNNAAFDRQERLPWETHADVETSDFAHAVLVGRDLEGVAIVGAGAIRMDRTIRWARSRSRCAAAPTCASQASRSTARPITR
jgi:polygalacturonase